jgi:hypothetical protein
MEEVFFTNEISKYACRLCKRMKFELKLIWLYDLDRLVNFFDSWFLDLYNGNNPVEVRLFKE